MLPRAKEIVDAAAVKMQDAVDFLEEDLKNYRVGKASPAIFNGVTVDYYGTPTPLNQVASITTPDAKTIAIQPWERNMISKIEKAILDANVGLTPSNNGEIIRCIVPALTGLGLQGCYLIFLGSKHQGELILQGLHLPGMGLTLLTQL